jgi:hypothetical protein
MQPNEKKTVINLLLDTKNPIAELTFYRGEPLIHGPFVTVAGMTRNAALNAFTEAMQKRLDENESKGGWEKLSEVECIRRANTNLNKFLNVREEMNFDELQASAVDAANYCMMIFDNLERFRSSEGLSGTENAGPGN